MPGIFDLCRYAKAQNYLLFVVTNQAGIGRGLHTEADFHELTRWMCDVFEQQDCAIDKVYFCPTHPKHGIGNYKVESVRRKPAPGMILEAAADFEINLARSVLVGDNISDIEVILQACNTMFYFGNMTLQHQMVSQLAWPVN